MLFSENKINKIVQRRHGDFAFFPRTPLFFFEGLGHANTEYGTSIHFKKINSQYFATILDNRVIFAYRYAIFKNYDNIKKKYCKKKSFNQTIRFV